MIHRGLTLHRFHKAVGKSLIKRYFAEIHPSLKLDSNIINDAEELETFLSDPRNAELKSLVEQDFKIINDICEKGKNLVVNAYKYFEIPMDYNLTPDSLAMKLFLDHQIAFDYAYSWFSYYHASSKISHHRMPGKFRLTDKKLEIFKKVTKEWFRNLAKGEECILTPYKKEDPTIILIKHGTYFRTIPYWKSDEIKFQSFRPAKEDILLYDRKKNILSIKASLPKDREQYIKSFSQCIMMDESLAVSEDRDTIYSLKPLQDGSFNWEGNEIIKKILLTEIRLELSGSTESVLKISSKDLRKTLANDIPEISLNTGKLIHARFRFILKIDGKKQPVSFYITPPDVSTLSQKKHNDIISEYLKEQEVKLV